MPDPNREKSALIVTVIGSENQASQFCAARLKAANAAGFAVKAALEFNTMSNEPKLLGRELPRVKLLPAPMEGMVATELGSDVGVWTVPSSRTIANAGDEQSTIVSAQKCCSVLTCQLR